jgi:surface protein
MKNIFKLALVMLLSALSGKASAQSGDFVTKWDLATTGSGANQLKFLTTNLGTVNYEWTELSPGTSTGSGTLSFSGTFPNIYATISGLPTGATIRLRIQPTNFKRFSMSNQGDKDRLLDVEQWGTAQWSSMASAFFGCRNLKITATDIPNLSSVTRAESMFEDCRKLETVPNMGSWNVSTITTLTSMFKDCYLFNQDISGWNTSNVVSFQNTFGQAKAFNQNLGSWDVSKASSHGISLAYSGMDCANYEATLNGWNASGATTKTLNAAGLNYGNAANAARASLVTKGWTITGDNSSNVCDAFITTWDLSIGGNATSLSIGTATGGSVSYSWVEIGGSAKSASGLTFSGNTLSITGLPSGKKIKLTIAPGNFQQIKLNNSSASKEKLTNVEQWGTTAWTSFQGAFFGCTNLNITATGIPNLANVKNMQDMFQTCYNLTTVPNIGSWNVSEVTNMTSLFNNARKFNENISGWNTAKVVALTNTFNNAYAFNQNLGGWNVNSIGSNGINLSGSGMSCDNYTATLIGWNNTCSTGKKLQANGLKYAPSLAARASLVTKGWTITGDATGSCSAPSVPGLEDQPAINEVIGKASIWPNPVADMLNIEINEIYQDEKLYLTVTDMKGSVLMSQTVTHGNSAISTAGWPNALYVVTLRSEHDIIMISKISKQ